MPDRIDRRKERTRQLLHKALLELIEERGLEGITVSDLTQRAEINRGTFYLHYKDVPDMLDQSKMAFMQGLRERLMTLEVDGLIQKAAADETDQNLVDVFAFIADHADLFRLLLGPGGDSFFGDQVVRLLKEHFYDKLLPLWQLEEARLNIPSDFLIAYVSAANLGFLQHWLETGMKQTPEQFARMVVRVVRTGPIHLGQDLPG
ncbi:TetR/AcrR family transcriptional regulator [Paenibacillus methanolicus]|uniref:AcrR family transcriptional regulator n=1 Tax=Paenibacillus methanolicus TaxID=582686 RepID=A0A5S5BU60_9BACL|nr:TetR/AcrR family transcriptional regulator C-terminal domain-containing protein [Paenibacillus methanolicus]TYP69836.1 AcrR family transcriptional regulator [Paenibacillus methanolicus]